MRQPHLLYLMTGLTGAEAVRVCRWLHADGLTTMPCDIDQMLAGVAEGERLLRERAATPPDPFTLDY